MTNRFKALLVSVFGRLSAIALVAVAVAVGGLQLTARPAHAQSARFRQVTDAVPGQYIVVFSAAAGPRGITSQAPTVAATLSATYGGEVLQVYTHAINGYAVSMDEAAAHLLSEDPRVLYVEQDGRGSVVEAQGNPPPGLDRIDQRALPLDATYTFLNTGAGVHAYVIDTGIRPTHAEFSGRASVAADFIGDGQNGIDCFGHGTHVAGTLGGVTYGVAKGVSLHAVRVLNCGGQGTTAQVIGGVDWVTANGVRPAVANMSLTYPASTALDTAVRNSIGAGITYVVAAGNDNQPSGARSPQRVSEAIIVGATTVADARASFSNFGPQVDLFAPGVDVLSAWYTGDFSTEILNGTSMAAPHVAGVVARHLQDNPAATPSQVSAAIVSNATSGVVTNPGSGSPNRLLYSAFLDPACTFSISPTTATHGAGAGTGTVEVTAPAGCAWTATSQASWISFPSGNSGTGDGTLSYAVEANPGSAPRTGTLTIAGQTFTVVQAGVSCTYSISPTSTTVASQGGTGSVSVTAPPGCAWTASSQAAWITVVSGASGSGNGTVSYSVASNPAGEGRTGTIVIAGRAFTIGQGALPCTYSISPSSASVGAGGGSFTVQVTAPPACAWTATSHADWISIVSGTGNGVGSVSYVVAANAGLQRTGTLVVAGQTFTVTQAANPCPSSIAPATANFTSAGGVGNFSLTTPAGCVWEATSNVPWIVPTLGRFGSGSATVGYSVQLNPGGAREGRIAVGGSSLRITQDPNPLLRSVDRPQDFQTLTQPFDVSGWAIDRRATSGTGVDTIHNWAFPAAGGQPIFVGVSAYGGARPDVAALFGAQFTNSGFGVFVRGLPPGQYQIHVFPHSSVTGAFENPQVRTITAQANPGGHVDTPAANATVPRSFVVAGWAFDRAAASGSGIDTIHIWAYPGGTDSGSAAIFLGVTTTTVDRPDVVAAYQDPQIVRCGYGTVVTVPAPGLYDVVVFARSALTGQFSPYVRRVTAQ